MASACVVGFDTKMMGSCIGDSIVTKNRFADIATFIRQNLLVGDSMDQKVLLQLYKLSLIVAQSDKNQDVDFMAVLVQQGLFANEHFALRLEYALVLKLMVSIHRGLYRANGSETRNFDYYHVKECFGGRMLCITDDFDVSSRFPVNTFLRQFLPLTSGYQSMYHLYLVLHQIIRPLDVVVLDDNRSDH